MIPYVECTNAVVTLESLMACEVAERPSSPAAMERSGIAVRWSALLVVLFKVQVACFSCHDPNVAYEQDNVYRLLLQLVAEFFYLGNDT